MRIALRVLAAIVGIVGAIVAFIVNLLYFGAARVGWVQAQNSGWMGLVLVLVGLVGAFLAVNMPLVGAVFLLLTGIAFFFTLHLAAFIASPLLLLAAYLAYRDSKQEETKAA